MKSVIMKLESMLAAELAEVTICEQVDSYIKAYQEARQAGEWPPDTLDFLHSIKNEGVYIEFWYAAINYLSDCVYRKTTPHHCRLARTLMSNITVGIDDCLMCTKEAEEIDEQYANEEQRANDHT